MKVWRIVGTITSAIIWLLVIGVGVMSFFFEWSFLFVAVAAIVAVIGTIFFVKIIPSLRWKWWRYEVREQEIELQHGIFIITRTLVPMVRVQHVDTVQGPLLRKYRLASIEISTAASRHEIPAVDIEEAEELRYKISKLARVAEEDV
nr:PH domain-containing protein [Bacillus sp. FJAT-50079]